MQDRSIGTALITGASSGIGATYADRLARRGNDLVLVARDRERLNGLAQRLRKATGVAVEVVPADLGTADGLLRIEQRLRSDGKITGLVNNAGVAGGGPIISANADVLESMIKLNVIAPTRLVAAIAPRLSAARSGAIVNIASVTPLMPGALAPTYPATKAYLLYFSEAIAKELSAYGVFVQAVLPGITRTEIWEKAGQSLDSLPPETVMEVDVLVDAALAGLDSREHITIPSLPDAADWEVFLAARQR